MDYEKKYKETLERAKGFLKRWEDIEEANTFLVLEEVKDIFPELKESEDEKIRKALIRFHKGSIDIDGIKGDEIVSWLEKQVPIDKEKMLIGARKDVASSIITYLDRNTLGMCLSNMECEDLVNAVVDSDWSKIYGYMKKKLEKQGEQKSDDKVEPKFHEGDWVACEGLNTAKIISIEGNRYELELLDGDKVFSNIDYIDRIFHLWTIQDARDGDVLYIKYDKDEWVIIFNSMNPEGYIIDHCSYCINNEFYNNSTPWGKVIESDIIHPATKEQCDLLFSKIREKGYEWNTKNKQLNEIES